MKRLLAVFALSVALPVFAAPEKAVVIRVADTASIVSAVSKLGEFAGNPMLAAMAAPGISANPATELFGPARAGVPMMAVVYADTEKAKACSPAAALSLVESCQLAFLYPVAKGKAAFLEAHEGAVEKDGVIKIAEPDDTFVAFSADETWVAMADDAARARDALANVQRAAEPLKGDLVRAKVTPAGLAFLMPVIEAACKESIATKGKGAQEALAESFKWLRQIKTLNLALRVDEAGLTVRTKMVPVEGSDFEKITPGTLSGDALAFAGADAFYARAYAKNYIQENFDAQWKEFTGFVAKQGLEMAWLTCTKQGATRTLTFDFDGCVKYFTTTGKAKFDAINPETFMQDYYATMSEGWTARPFEGPAGAFALTLKGVPMKSTAAARFARIAPEAAAKKPCSMMVFSPYTAIRALAPKAVALLPEEEAAVVKPMLQMLPPEGPGGIAAYDWREGKDFYSVMRVSPDEIKGISTLIQTCVGYAVQQQMKAMQFEVDDDDDDEDDDDEDED